MLALPAQTPGLAARHGLTKADTDRAAWAIEPDGRKHEGAAAINCALAELPGPWPRLAGAYRIQPLRAAEDVAYWAVVRTRHWLSHLTRTAPECDDPAVDCGERTPAP